jgi:hypothetical protein
MSSMEDSVTKQTLNLFFVDLEPAGNNKVFILLIGLKTRQLQ